jgi:2-C-methyl-D-erythritol 4-phosphate cytidylyltransferase
MLCAMLEVTPENRSEIVPEPEDVESVAALVLGAGRGERLGHVLPKAFVPLARRSLIEWSIRALVESQSVGRILPVLDPSEFERFKMLGLRDIPRLADPVAGGAERQDSMRAGLRSLPDEIRWVAVHDAARCLVSPGDVARVVAKARECGAAILAERVSDTIKRVVGGKIVETPPRAECWAAQTPQVIRRDWLEEAVEKARVAERLATDDAQLLEWAGFAVQVVEARTPNPKLTRPEDLIVAESFLRAAGEEATR